MVCIGVEWDCICPAGDGDSVERQNDRNFREKTKTEIA